MSRHCLVACVVALACTVTAVVLAEAGVFEGAGRWLFEQYVAESLLKGDGSVSWRWLHPAVAGVAALVVAWVAVDAVPWSTRTGVLAVAGLMAAFLSLTLALYAVSFNPLPALLAATLAWLTGGLLAETPGGRREREWQRVIGDRLAPATMAEWRKTGEPLPLDPEVHEGTVLAVRILDPLPTAAKAAAHLAAMRRVLDEAAAFLHTRGGTVLDVPSGDGVRAFFGLGPKAPATGAEEAAETALALAGFLKEEATLAAQGGRPALACGMGLSFGWLLCGKHGPARAAFWTATGPTAEQARQLAALNARHGTRILVGRRLAERIRDQFDLRPVDGEAVQSLVAARAAPPADEAAADLAETEPTEEPERHPPAEATPAARDPMPPPPPPPPPPRRPSPARPTLEPRRPGKSPSTVANDTNPAPHSTDFAMRKVEYPDEIQRLVSQFKRLPGIGPRSAERIAVSLLTGKSGNPLELARSIEAAALGITLCTRCGFFQAVAAPCALCDADDRDPATLCVVEQPTDVLPLERTGAFSGRYHVLGGRLAPLDNVHPEDLRIDSLIRRIDSGGVTEIILATGSDVEGEATAHYLAGQLGSRPHLKVTRLAQGLPAGGGLEHADDLTLLRALSGRRAI